MPDVRPELGKECRAGPHRVTLEWPDIVFLHIDGDVNVEHMKVFIAAVNECPGDVCVLRDARKSRSVTLDAREYMVKMMPKGKVIAFISFGAPFHARTVITMLARAVRLIRRESPILEFTKTEEEARARIDRIRLERRSRSRESHS